MVNENQLSKIMPNLGSAKRTQYLPHLQQAMEEFEINSPLRTSAFLAQLAHESGEFRWMEEIWGPTTAQRRYEPVTSLSKSLGNTQPGDGKRFKGRGPIQLTGRSNYRRYGTELELNLEENPLQAATPEAGFRIACLFWKKNGLNELADKEMFKTITKRINGGFNGLAERTRYYVRAKGVLLGGSRGVNDENDFTPDAATHDSDYAPEDTGDNAENRSAQFARGSEAINDDDGER